MEDRWINKNIDLSMINNRLVQFFEKRNFVSFQESSEREYHIIVMPSRYHDILEEIHVYISGQPDDFKVKFDAGQNQMTTLNATDSSGYSCPCSNFINVISSSPQWREVPPFM